MPPNGVEEWRARIGHWENRKLRWYQAHCGSRPHVPLHLHLERVISEARPMLCVLLLFSLVVTGVCEAGNGAFSSLHKLVGKARCCTCVRRSRCGKVWSATHATLLYSLCLALCLLLLVDGDVETNPGPISNKLLVEVDDSELTEEDTLAVYREVVSLTGNWSDMCLVLGLLPSDQSAIEAAHPGNPHNCLKAVVVKWLQKVYNYQKFGSPTWRMLVEAVGDPAGGNNVTLAETIAKKHPVKASTKLPPDPRESHHLCREFATTFPEIANILNTFVQVSKLKTFLENYCHPLYPEQLYIDPKIYRDASTTDQVMKSLFPQYINYMHYFLLEDIVVKFQCDRAKEVLQQYIEQKDNKKRKLEDHPGPITTGEIEQFHGTKRLKVGVKEDTRDATVEIIGDVQDALEMATGVDRAVIVYAYDDPGSILLTFLIPGSILHIFHELNTEDLTILANSGVIKLEVDEMVIDNIQQYSTVKVAADSDKSTKQAGLEYYLQQRATEMTSERYSFLLKMLGYVDPKILNDFCSEEFLKRLSKDIQDWKKLAPYFSIQEWYIEELVCKYPNEDDQKYQALLCWKRAARSTATYYNLLEILMFHGKVDEVEALLQRLGEGPVVLHTSRWLKQQYLAHDSWQQWREVPNMIQFDQRLGELTTQASNQLKNMDYSNCYYDIKDEFPSSVTQISMKALVNACTTSDHSWSSKSCILIKGAPGQGKSFLISKLCRYWAKGYGMRSTTLMFWVDCSQFQNKRMTFNQLLSQLLPVETHHISKWIRNKQGRDVIFILDGYNQQQSDGLFGTLASQSFLPKSVVLIASTCTPNKISVKQFELLSLSEDQISRQVVHCFSSKPSKVEDFYLHLTNNPDLRLLASIPVYLYTILFVCDKLFTILSCELPVTWTELFTNMMMLFVQSKLQQIETPPGSSYQRSNAVQSFLSEVSTMAFENLTSESLLLTSSTARPLGHGSGVAPIHICSKPMDCSEKQRFQFSSPLLKQFLAALHVHSQPLPNQTKLMVQKSDLNFLWQFYTGLLSESYDKFQFLKSYCKNKITMLASCAYEADWWAGDIPSVFRDNILTAADMHHIVIKGCKFPPDLSFERCVLGRAAVFQLTRQVHTLARSGQCGFRLSFNNCIFSSEGLVTIAAAPFQRLRFGGLRTESICDLAVGLKRCVWAKGLKNLDLRDNKIGDKETTILADALRVNQSLKSLSLYRNSMTESGAIALASALQQNKSLEELNLGDNKIGDKGATGLGDALRVNHSLKTLSLYRSGLTSTGAIALARALQQNKSLKELNLEWDEIHWRDIGDEGAIALADSRVFKNFKKLNLRDNGLTPTGAILLARTLQHNKSLKELNLKGNKLTSTGAIALAIALQHNKSLKELNLEWDEIQWRDIGDEGAIALADPRVFKYFKTLNLKDNRLTDTGAIALARALQHNKSLEELNLSNNEIGSEGATMLADALKVNQSLKTLELEGNKAGNSGATALADALRVNQSLKILNVCYNSLTSTGAIALARALQQNKSLEELNLEWDEIQWRDIGDDGAIALADPRVFKNFKTLNLGGNQLTDTGAIALATALQHNKSLEELNLEQNRIEDSGASALADALRVNQNLKLLNFTSNQLTFNGAIVLSTALQHNKSLEELNLMDNAIGNGGAAALADALIVNQSLKTLNVNQNGLTSTGAIALAGALQQNKSLEELNLELNETGIQGATALANALRVNQSLKKLNLKDSQLTDTGAIALATALQHNKSLEELNLSNNEIGSEGATVLADTLKVNQNLKTLDLSNNEIGSEGAAVLADALKVNQSLKTLDLYHSSLSDSGAVALARALQQNMSLEELNVYHNSLTSTGAIALAKALQQNKSLRELNLEWDEIQWRDIGDAGAIALADPRVFKNSKTLNLGHNQLTDTGAIVLARALQHNKSLEELILGENGIRESGVSALADALRVNQRLKTLNLGHNQLTDTGAIVLATALQHNKSLEELNLERNKIGDSGASGLADALKVNQSLKTLNFGNNQLTDTGAIALATALQHKSLEELNLGENGIREYGVSALADALRVNRSLKTLNLGGNGIGDSGASALADALKVNQSLETLKLGYRVLWSVSENTRRLLTDNARIDFFSFRF